MSEVTERFHAELKRLQRLRNRGVDDALTVLKNFQPKLYELNRVEEAKQRQALINKKSLQRTALTNDQVAIAESAMATFNKEVYRLIRDEGLSWDDAWQKAKRTHMALINTAEATTRVICRVDVLGALRAGISATDAVAKIDIDPNKLSRTPS